MKRKILLLASLFAFSAYAQDVNEDERMANIDWSEDSTDVTTIQDIIKQQQKVSTTHATERHFEDVWGRRSYFNIVYNNATLSPKGSVPTGVPSINGGNVKDMSSDWGLSIQYGRSYRLHKNPIDNTLQFYIDYTGIDLAANHFKKEGGSKVYDSSNKITSKDLKDSYYYTPWNLAKYEFSYGMSIGPSLTIAPIVKNNNPGLHYLTLNLYYHIGYHISFLYMPNDKDADLNPATSKADPTYSDKEKIGDETKLDWGHGLMHSFGLNISWKFIGLGYEYRTASLSYKPIVTDTFGKDKYDFSSSYSRIYLQIRM